MFSLDLAGTNTEAKNLNVKRSHIAGIPRILVLPYFVNQTK